MNNGYLKVEHSLPLNGSIELCGAKNAVLVTIASLLLTRGLSVLHNVPNSADVYGMIDLVRCLGAEVTFDEKKHQLSVDTSLVNKSVVSADIMQKMRASVLVMGPLLATFGEVTVGFPGGCSIGSRPIDYHLKNFIKMGVIITENKDFLCAQATQLQAKRLVLEYPSVGATENILMLAVRIPGTTHIINAALEPELLDLIAVLQKMGADITVQAPATLVIRGVEHLSPIEHHVMYDRLEAGSLLLAAAATGGCVHLPHASENTLDVFLSKLEEMGHEITVGTDGRGIILKATLLPKAVSFKTGPFPGFPTDLQAPMMALQTTADGVSIIEETVFENRFLHIPALQKMGANIVVKDNKAIVTGVQSLQGAAVAATDIRASMALVVAGLMAQGTTIISEIHHWKRGYDALDKKLSRLGAFIELRENSLMENIIAKNTLSVDSL